VGAAAVAQVEAQRERRTFDAALPPLHDLRRLPQRLALVQQWEGREWEGREASIAVAQQAQLQMVEAAVMVGRCLPQQTACLCSRSAPVLAAASHGGPLPATARRSPGWWLPAPQAGRPQPHPTTRHPPPPPTNAPQAREEELDQLRQQRVEAAAAAAAARRAPKLAAIHAGRIKTLRHLAQARRRVDPKEAHKWALLPPLPQQRPQQQTWHAGRAAAGRRRL
jgi:hypothetical protein